MAATAGAGSGSIAWTYISEPSEGSDQLSAQDLRAGLEKGTDDVKLQLLRHIVTSTLNGTPYVRLATACERDPGSTTRFGRDLAQSFTASKARQRTRD